MARPDWQSLPVPLVDADDPAAGFLARATSVPMRPSSSCERPRSAPSRSSSGSPARASTPTVSSTPTGPRRTGADLRGLAHAWYRGLAALRRQPDAAVRASARVPVVPGEAAPKLAMARARARGRPRLGRSRSTAWCRGPTLLHHGLFGPAPVASAPVTSSTRWPPRPGASDLGRLRRRAGRQGLCAPRRPGGTHPPDVLAAAGVVDALPLKAEPRTAPRPGPGGRPPGCARGRATVRPGRFDFALTDDGVRLGLEAPTDRSHAGRRPAEDHAGRPREPGPPEDPHVTTPGRPLPEVWRDASSPTATSARRAATPHR